MLALTRKDNQKWQNNGKKKATTKANKLNDSDQALASHYTY